jgi:hypothetical protein
MAFPWLILMELTEIVISFIDITDETDAERGNQS